MKKATIPSPVAVYIDDALVNLRFTDTNWVEGSCCNYYFWAKVYNVYSKYGIDGGRISKLLIRKAKNNKDSSNGRDVVNYDRGWDIMPKKEDQWVYEKIMLVLNMVPIRPDFE